MMYGLSASHLVILAIVVIVFMGARRIPELGESLGKGLKEFKKGLQGIEGESEEPPRQLPKEPEETKKDDSEVS